MKRIVSLVVAVSMVLSMFATVFAAKSYSDLTGENAKFASAVAALTELKVDGQSVVNGYPDGTFGPEKNITRAEFAKMIVICLGVGSEVEALATKTVFSDVPATHWASGWINAAAQSKVIVGYPDGTFGPEKTITYAEAFTMALRALGYGNVADFEGTWPTAYMLKAVELELTNDMDSVKSDVAATRGNVAILLWNMLRTPMWRVTEESENSGMTLSNQNQDRMLNVKFPDYTYVEDVYVAAIDVTDNEDVIVYLFDIIDGEPAEEPITAQVRNVDISRLILGEKVTALVKKGAKNEDDTFLTLTPENEMVEGVVTKVTVEDGVITKITVNDTEYKIDATQELHEGDIVFNDYVVFEVTGKKVNNIRFTFANQGMHAARLTAPVIGVVEVVKTEEIENLKTALRTIKEDALVIKDGEWIDREDLEVGDVYSELKDNDGTSYFMVTSERVEGTLESYTVKTVKGDASHLIVIDGDEYRNVAGDDLEIYEGADNDKEVKPEDIYGKKAKDNKYLDKDVEMLLDFLGNPFKILFGEVDDLNNGGSFYTVVNGVWDVAGKGGTTKNISLVGFDGEGASDDAVSEGVDYQIKKNRNAYIPEELDADELLAEPATPKFVWANFDTDGETVKTLIVLEDGLTSGDGEEEAKYTSKYDIVDISGLEVEDGKVVVDDLEIKLASTVPVMTATPLKDADDVVEGFAVALTEGVKNKTEFPEGSFLAYDASKKVARAAYVFVAEDAESTELFYGLVEEYDEATTNGVGYATINGEKYELDDEFDHEYVEEGYMVAYSEFKGVIKVRASWSPEDLLDDGNFQIIDKETESDTMVFTSGDSFDLEEDSDDLEEYEDWTVVEVAADTEDDNETLKFSSVEKVGEGLTSVPNKKGVRVMIGLDANGDEEEEVLLIVTGIKVDEVMNGGILEEA